jgi:CubicO group peptidase (beta-lactamase class C family)
MEKDAKEIVKNLNKDSLFSGVVSITGPEGVIYNEAFGYRNRAEELPNNMNTSLAIASGTKLFTSLSICQMLDKGYLSLNDKICNIIPYDLKLINKDITVFHLLTHTSGIGDYIDEEVSSEYFDILKLYDNRPVHKWDSLAFYLPMFNELPQKFAPGERFGYSNAGFVLLGLVVESISKKAYQQYVKKNIFDPLGFSHTGFYRMNNLPKNTALGYVYNESRREYETNVLYMPIIGGSDGGLFTCSADLVKLWNAIFSNQIFSVDMRDQFLMPHIRRSEFKYYGLGVYIWEETPKRAY